MDQCIFMCADNECPARAHCYRYRAIPSDLQFFSDYWRRRDGGPNCSAFWFIDGRKDIRELKDIATERLNIKEAKLIEG